MFFNGQNHFRARRAISGLAAITGLLLSGSALAGEAEILWDQFGIPHIYGPDLLSVVRGLGYAEMENHAETILMNAAYARGRSAEYFGRGAFDTNINNYTNIYNDITVRTEGIPSRARAWLLTGGVEQAAIIQAFVEGENEYVENHSNTIDPSFLRVRPLVPTDITAGIPSSLSGTTVTGANILASSTAAIVPCSGPTPSAGSIFRARSTPLAASWLTATTRPGPLPSIRPGPRPSPKPSIPLTFPLISRHNSWTCDHKTARSFCNRRGV